MSIVFNQTYLCVCVCVYVCVCVCVFIYIFYFVFSTQYVENSVYLLTEQKEILFDDSQVQLKLLRLVIHSPGIWERTDPAKSSNRKENQDNWSKFSESEQ